MTWVLTQIRACWIRSLVSAMRGQIWPLFHCDLDTRFVYATPIGHHDTLGIGIAPGGIGFLFAFAWFQRRRKKKTSSFVDSLFSVSRFCSELCDPHSLRRNTLKARISTPAMSRPMKVNSFALSPRDRP